MKKALQNILKKYSHHQPGKDGLIETVNIPPEKIKLNVRSFQNPTQEKEITFTKISVLQINKEIQITLHADNHFNDVQLNFEHLPDFIREVLS